MIELPLTDAIIDALTQEELLALTGRHLDVAVARRVHGWSVRFDWAENDYVRVDPDAD